MRINHYHLILILVVVCGCALGGCSGRSFYTPRSEEVERLRSQGIPARTIDEEKVAFLQHEELQKERLMALIRKRSQPDYRDDNYRFGPLDEIELNVFDVPELNLTTKVRQSGFISLPLIGAVKASGLTESELLEEIERRLKEYVRNPQVSIFVTAYGSQKVAVMGAVRKPGPVALKKGSNSLLEIVSQAGGVSEKAGNFINFVPAELSGIATTGTDVEARAQLALASDGHMNLRETGIEISLDQILGTSGGIPLEIPVRGGDMIVVPEAGKVMVEGEVQKTGSYDLGQQLTLLSALAAAGGITYGAKVDEVEVIRDIGAADKVRLVVDLTKLGTGEERDPKLRNGDIIRIPSASGRRLAQDTFEGITKIINFGVGGSVNLGP